MTDGAREVEGIAGDCRLGVPNGDVKADELKDDAGTGRALSRLPAGTALFELLYGVGAGEIGAGTKDELADGVDVMLRPGNA